MSGSILCECGCGRRLTVWWNDDCRKHPRPPGKKSKKIQSEYASSQRHSCYAEKGKLEFNGDGLPGFMAIPKVSKAVATRICEMLDIAYVEGGRLKTLPEIEGEDFLDD